MSTLTIELSDDLRAFVDAEAAENGFPSAAEFLADLIRQTRRRKAKQALDAMLLEGLQKPVDAADSRGMGLDRTGSLGKGSRAKSSSLELRRPHAPHRTHMSFKM